MKYSKQIEELRVKVKEIIKRNENKPNRLLETLNYIDNYSGHKLVKKEIARNKDLN